MGGEPTTDRHKRNLAQAYLPIGCVAAVLLVIIPAAVTWSGDRSELRAATAANASQDQTIKEHTAQIEQVKLRQAERMARDEDMRRRLDEMQASINRVLDKLDKLGARP